MLTQKALTFATEKHSGQKRRSGEDYIEHPKRVAKLVGDDEVLICIALLHDTLEDTNATYEELSTEFGQVIADGVTALTNDKNEIAKIGKGLYIAQKISTLSQDLLLIKLADRLDNVQDMDYSRSSYAKDTKLMLENVINTDSRIAQLVTQIEEKIQPYL